MCGRSEVNPHQWTIAVLLFSNTNIINILSADKTMFADIPKLKYIFVYYYVFYFNCSLCLLLCLNPYFLLFDYCCSVIWLLCFGYRVPVLLIIAWGTEVTESCWLLYSVWILVFTAMSKHHIWIRVNPNSSSESQFIERIPNMNEGSIL